MTLEKRIFPDEEEQRLLPCPFCGGQAYLKKVLAGNGISKTGKIPDGAVETGHRIVGGRVLIGWERFAYAVHCNTPSCLCKLERGKFRNKEAAIQAWNQRI